MFWNKTASNPTLSDRQLSFFPLTTSVRVNGVIYRPFSDCVIQRTVLVDNAADDTVDEVFISTV